MQGVQLPHFRLTRTLANLRRMRVSAWIIITIISALIYLSFIAIQQVDTPAARAAGPYILILWMIMAAISIIFLMIIGGLKSEEDLTARHRFCEVGFHLFLLLVPAVLSYLLEPLGIGIGAYVAFIFAVAVLIHLDTSQTLIAYSMAFAVMAAVHLWLRVNQVLVVPQLIICFVVTLIAFSTSRFIFSHEVRDYMNLRMIELQNRQLEKVNIKLKESNEMLRQLSYIDALTEIPNRRYFNEVIEREWRRAAREGKPLALIMIDIDRFKRFNDKYGHQAGDDSLIQVAAALAGVLKRPGDLLARYGGEEFVAILPDTLLQGASRVAELMLASVEALGITHEGMEGGCLTVSLGVACRQPLNEDKFVNLISDADSALYDAKQAGRNRYAAAG